MSKWSKHAKQSLSMRKAWARRTPKERRNWISKSHHMNSHNRISVSSKSYIITRKYCIYCGQEIK